MSAEHARTLDLMHDPSWVIRRKETLELLSERLVRHRVTVDFRPPSGAGRCSALPLFVLRKAPGDFTEFDFVGATGTSLSLPARAENIEVSTGILLAAAERVLKASRPTPLTVTTRLRRELEFIASSDADDAIAQLLHEWPPREVAPSLRFRLRFWRRPAPRTYPPNKVALMNDAEFAWLVWMLARNSLVALTDDAESRSSRILKLGYVEEVVDLVRSPASRPIPRLMRLLGRLFYRLGWRGYPIAVQIPWAGARTFHFEMHAPDGVEILEAGIRETGNAVTKGVRSRVHLYERDAAAAKELTAYVQTRIRGAGFAGSAALTAVFIATAIWLAWRLSDQLAGKQLGGAPSLLLLFPGLVATYLARPEHALVVRLLRIARFTLVLTAVAAWTAAVRLALLDKAATARQLNSWFEPLAYVAAGLAGVLLVSWVLPLRLSHPLRRPFRGLALGLRHPPGEGWPGAPP